MEVASNQANFDTATITAVTFFTAPTPEGE